MSTNGRPRALLTVDFEDYRRQLMRDYTGRSEPYPREVRHQLDLTLELFEEIDASATFFAVGRLTEELDASAWQAIVARHRLGAHGYEHEWTSEQGPDRFAEDLRQAKESLEDASGTAIISYRAPYFGIDGCEPWFGAVLAEAGIRLDSSVRLADTPAGFAGTLPLEGSAGAVVEVPLPSLGRGPKRIAVIGGTYFRVLPLAVIRRLLDRAGATGFIPMIYLHPYDLDPEAPPLDVPPGPGWLDARTGDTLRRYGRAAAVDKLRQLAAVYRFEPLETVVEG